MALVYPPAFTWFISGTWELGGSSFVLMQGGFVTPGLQVIMLAMGLTLRVDDFRAAWAQKRLVLLGVLLQFTIMPFLGFLLARVFALPEPLAAGLVLVCCCPGGTASNVIAYLARADVALSVSMTACATLVAALLTPTLSALLVGQDVEVDALQLYLTTGQVVILPVALGIVMRRLGEKRLSFLLPALPALAVLAIVLIVAGVIGVQRERIISSGAQVLAAVVTTHGLAFLLAYWVARWRGASEKAARTISIEVGMQNSGLGVVLARSAFPDPLVAVTPALSAVVHCLYGSGLSAWWGRRES